MVFQGSLPPAFRRIFALCPAFGRWVRYLPYPREESGTQGRQWRLLSLHSGGAYCFRSVFPATNPGTERSPASACFLYAEGGYSVPYQAGSILPLPWLSANFCGYRKSFRPVPQKIYGQPCGTVHCADKEKYHPDTQNEIKKRKKKAPIICAAVVITFLGIFLATILFPLIGEVMGEALAVGFLLIYGGVIVAAIVGVVAALRQRLQEIEGGDETEDFEGVTRDELRTLYESMANAY